MLTSAGALSRSISMAAVAPRSVLWINYPIVSMMKAGCLSRKSFVFPMMCGAYPMAFSNRAGSADIGERPVPETPTPADLGDKAQPEAPAKKASSLDDLDDDYEVKPPFLNSFLIKGMNEAMGRDGSGRCFEGPNEDGHYVLRIPMNQDKIRAAFGSEEDDFGSEEVDFGSEEDED